MIKNVLVLICALLCSLSASAQPLCGPVSDVLNNVTPKKHIPNRTPMPYANIREADIMWEKWVWRTIDMREKMNHTFYYPFEPTNNRANLLTIIQCGISEGKLTPYSPLEGDDFMVAMSSEEALGIGNRVDTVQIPDLDNPDITHDTIVYSKLDPKTVLEYHVKEIWFFDKQRSMVEVRIVGICPVREIYDRVSGEYKGKQEMYWLYFPQLRNVMVNQQAFNRFNNAGPNTYDDIFTKRIFSSYAYKESNVYDRVITDYKAGMDALLESDRIKTDILNFEHDIWDF